MKKHNVLVYEQGELILKAPSGDPNDFTLTILGNLNVLGNSSLNSNISQTLVRNAVSAMVSGNTESGISVTYNSSTQKLDFIVSSFRLTLSGDATGTAIVNSLTDTTIPVTITGSSSVIIVPDGDEHPATTQLGIGFHALDAINSPTNPIDISLDAVDRNLNYTVIGVLDSQNNNRGFQLLVNNSTDNNEVTGKVFVRTKNTSDEFWSEPKALAWLSDIESLSSNSPTLTLSGDATGSATFTNLNDATLNVTVLDNSHNHDHTTIDGLDPYIKDKVGEMVSGNSENGINVTYDQTAKKLNFTVTVDPSTDWNDITNKPFGEAGTVYYIKESLTSEVETDFIYHETRIVDTQDKLDFYLNETQPTQQQIFDTWYRFSHLGDPNTVQSVPTETDEWFYDTVNERVQCSFNSTSYIGFVSQNSYDEYTHEVTLSSTDASDDDAVGVVIAFDFDLETSVSNGANGLNPNDYQWDIDTTSSTLPKESTLSVIRTRTQALNVLFAGGVAFNYAVVYNYGYNDSRIIANGTAFVEDVTGAYNNNFVKIRVERNKNIIRVLTTEFSDAVAYDSSFKGELLIDLTSDPDLNKFVGKKPYGYSCLSQPNSIFYDISFTDPNNRVFDVRNDTSWTLQNGTWINEPIKLVDLFGAGRLVQDIQYRDLYYSAAPPKKIMEGLSSTTFTEQDFEDLYNSRNYKFEVTIPSGQNQTIDLSSGLSVPFNPSDLVISIKVLDQDPNSLTFNKYIDAYGVGTYSLPVSGTNIIITNTFSTTLTYKVTVRI